MIVAAGCADRGAGAQVASSTSQVGYAVNYPEVLERVTAESQAQRKVAKDVSAELAQFPNALKNPDWALVEQVYTQAVDEGKSEAYVTRFEESAVVNRFFSEEKQAISGRVAHSAESVAKEKGCEVELQGPTAWGLESAVQKQLEERTRAESGVHALINDNEKQLGAHNTQTLRAQADKLSVASYVINLRSEFLRNDLETLSDKAGSIRGTLSEALEKETAKAKPNKKRVAELQAALDKLEVTGQAADEALKTAEKDGNAARKSFDKAVEALHEDVRARAAAPKK
jgi:hypothetical protein